MAELFINPARATDSDNNPLPGAKLYFYTTGTTTPEDVYTTSALSVAHSNPVEADSAGNFPAIYLDPLVSYRAVCKNSTGATTVYDLDPITTGLDAGSVSFTQSGTGAASATVQSKLRQVINAADFTGFDSTGVAASTTAIQAAINEAAARGRCDVLIPTGAKTGALTIPANVTLVGPESKASLVAASGTYSTITINGSDAGVRNLTITETAKGGGATFTLACGTTGKDRITVENVITIGSWQLFEDSGSGSGVHTTTKLRDIQAKSHRGPGVVMNRGFAFLELDHVVIDYVGVSASDFTGFAFAGTGLGAGAGGLILERCDVLGTMGVTTNPNQIGYTFTDLNAVRIHNTRADTCGSNGFVFDTVNGVWFNDATASLCDGHGFVFTDCTTVIGTLVSSLGRNYLSSPAANKDGLRFVSGNVGINLGPVVTRDMTGHGAHKVAANTGAIILTGHQSFNNTGRGVKSVGDSPFAITGYQYGGNTAGNYDLGGATDYIMAGQLNSGAVVASAGPGPVTG